MEIIKIGSRVNVPSKFKCDKRHNGTVNLYCQSTQEYLVLVDGLNYSEYYKPEEIKAGEI